MTELNESAEMLEVAEPTETQSEETQEVAEPDVTEEVQSKSDSAFAEMRRNLEQYERQNAELQEQLAEYDNTLGLFFQGDNKIAQARAHYNEVPVEQVIADMEMQNKAKGLEEQVQQLKAEKDELVFQRIKQDDLNELKELGAEINDVEELGRDFFAYRGAGLTATQAYEVLQMKKGTPPKSMGTVKPSKSQPEYFTKADVDKMSEDEIEANLDKIKQSMSKW